MERVYIVFNGYSFDQFNGSWGGEELIDSVWDDKESAKERIKDLANEYIAKQWYEIGDRPHLDYIMEWNEDGTDVIFAPCPYEQTHFYVREHILRSGWTKDYKDLPIYFTTAET